MYGSVVNYFIGKSRRRCWTSAPHMLLMLAACSAITTWTQNVSGEISNHIEEVPIKERSSVDSTEPKLLEKSSIASVSDLKSNDSEKLRQSRYLRTLPPSSLPYRSKQQRSSVSPSAAVAAAAAAEDDLRHFGKILKYYAVPYDGGGGGKYPGRGPEPMSPLPSRPAFAPKSRYRYHKDEVHYAPAAAAKNKWRLRGGNGGGGFPGHGGFASEQLIPYDDYYEGGHSTEATLEDDDDGGAGFYDSSNNEDDQRDNWYVENYRKLQAQKHRQPAYEDTEVALSLQHAVGKRLPFTSHERDNSEHYGPNMAAFSGGGGDSRYHKFNKLNRGRGEASGEWLGGKRGGNVNSFTKQHHHRLQRPFNSPPQPHKYSPFDLDESHHRFKLDYSQSRHPPMNFHHDVHDDQSEKQERENAIKLHLHRRRNKQRLRGDRDRERVKYPSSLFGGDGGDDEEVDQGASVYESSADVAHDHENAIATSSARRPLAGSSVYEDDVVYSSRYRNKQAAAAAAAAGAAVGGGSDDINVDEADPSRLFVNYHDHDQTAAGGTLSSRKKSKFSINEDSRKSNSASSSIGSDEIYEDEDDDRDNDAAAAINKNYSLKKSNRKVSKSTGSFVSASSTSSPTSSFSASSSPYSIRKVNNRRSSMTTSSTTPPPTSSATTTTTMDLDDAWHLQTSHSYGVSGGVVDAESDMNSYSNADEAAGGGGDFKSQSHFQPDGISASELIAYMSASPSETVVNKQDRYTRPNTLGYPFVRTFSEQHDKLKSKYYHHSPLPSINDQDFEINLDQFSYRRR
ncbi:dentin sialophosphoprotein-like [Planococcus citri]|uniref:dentin sialophosphoprotein-like n=1 Tax=Planococcus citri TaxID=170843 RepID=UPI0031FA321C